MRGACLGDAAQAIPASHFLRAQQLENLFGSRVCCAQRMEPDGRLALAERVVVALAEAQLVAGDLRAARAAL
jgi:hypothetical protein